MTYMLPAMVMDPVISSRYAVGLLGCWTRMSWESTSEADSLLGSQKQPNYITLPMA